MVTKTEIENLMFILSDRKISIEHIVKVAQNMDLPEDEYLYDLGALDVYSFVLRELTKWVGESN